MDSIDKKLLLELTRKSRQPLTQLSKKIKISREVLNYRIERLKKNKTIISFTTEIDIQKLGFVGTAIFLNIKSTKYKEFRDYLQKSKFVSWVAELSGIWSFGFSIYGKSNLELKKRFDQIYNKFKSEIIDYRFTLHKENEFFYEKYFDSKPIIKQNSKKHKLDKKDKIILKNLSNNSRLDSVSLSKLVSLSAPAVASRIKSLEKSGIIKKYSLFVDVSKLNLYQYSIFSLIKDKKEQLISYLREHHNISFIAQYVDDPFIEYGIIVDNPYKLRNILNQIEDNFSDNKIIEVSLFHNEFVSIGPPGCVFD